MAKVNAKLQWATRKGEKAIQAVLRDTQRRRDDLANLVVKQRAGLPADTAIQAKRLLNGMDRLIGFGGRALSHLPVEPIPRAKAI